MKQRQRKRRLYRDRIVKTFRVPAALAAFMNNMDPATRSAFVAKALREYLK